MCACYTFHLSKKYTKLECSLVSWCARWLVISSSSILFLAGTTKDNGIRCHGLIWRSPRWNDREEYSARKWLVIDVMCEIVNIKLKPVVSKSLNMQVIYVWICLMWVYLFTSLCHEPTRFWLFVLFFALNTMHFGNQESKKTVFSI